MSVSRTSSLFCIKVILNNGLFPLWDFHTQNHGCCIHHVFIICMTYSRHFIQLSYPCTCHREEMGYCIVKFTHIKLILLLVQNAGGSNSSVMFDISRWFAMILKFPDSLGSSHCGSDMYWEIRNAFTHCNSKPVISFS